MSQATEERPVDDTFRFTEQSVVVRRPHFRLVGNEMFFLISKRPCANLSLPETQLWNALETDRDVASLREICGDHVTSAIRHLVKERVCDILSPDRSRSRRLVLVIEPHCDDAVLSLGGTLWARRAACEFTIATLASRSNFTSYFCSDRNFFEADTVSALRAAEGALAARLLGGRYLALGLEEATLRYSDGDWSVDWFKRHGVAVRASIGRQYREDELRRWTERVRQCLSTNNFEEVWIPIGTRRRYWLD